MPYSNGQYTAPANSWNPAVPGTTIESSAFNTTLSDLETALSTAVLKDGTQTITANIPMAGFKFTGVNTNSGNTSRSELVSGATLQDGAPLDAGDTAGSSTVYTATLVPAITAYADKQFFRVKFDEASGAAPTINFNSVGAKKLYKNVAGTATQIAANDIPQNFIGLLRYDTALDAAAGGFWVTNLASLTNVSLANFAEGAAPATPAANSVNIYAKSDGQMYSMDDAGIERPMSLTPAIVADSRNLVATAVSVTACDIDADEVMLKTTNGVAYVASSVNLTVAITTSGVNGLDTGVEANSTWYYLYVIYNPATATVAGLISASSTAPTMPAGYTYKALVSFVYNNSGGDFDGYWQAGRQGWINKNALNNGTASAAGTYQSLSLTTIVPPIAKTVQGQLGSSLTSGAAFIQVAGNSSGLGAQIAVIPFVASSFDSYYAAANFAPIPLITAQTLFWRSFDNTSARNRIDITGWTF
jgi:hypothetical protein